MILISENKYPISSMLPFNDPKIFLNFVCILMVESAKNVDNFVNIVPYRKTEEEIKNELILGN